MIDRGFHNSKSHLWNSTITLKLSNFQFWLSTGIYNSNSTIKKLFKIYIVCCGYWCWIVVPWNFLNVSWCLSFLYRIKFQTYLKLLQLNILETIIPMIYQPLLKPMIFYCNDLWHVIIVLYFNYKVHVIHWYLIFIFK